MHPPFSRLAVTAGIGDQLWSSAQPGESPDSSQRVLGRHYQSVGVSVHD